MSGVLDRMAQRALGTLPTVQPLLPSRFTPAREEARGPLALQGIVEQTERTAPAVGPTGAASQQAGTDREAAARLAEDDRNSELKLSARRTYGGEHLDEARSARAFASGFRRHGPPIAAGDSSSQPLPDVAGDGSQLRAVPQESVVPGFRNDPRREPAEADMRRADSHSEVRTPGDAARKSPVLINGRATRKREPQAGVPAEERTEINISIGSIELRAPRAEQSAKPAPFRPRVTLDEFLHRGRGSRS